MRWWPRNRSGNGAVAVSAPVTSAARSLVASAIASPGHRRLQGPARAGLGSPQVLESSEFLAGDRVSPAVRARASAVTRAVSAGPNSESGVVIWWTAIALTKSGACAGLGVDRSLIILGVPDDGHDGVRHRTALQAVKSEVDTTDPDHRVRTGPNSEMSALIEAAVGP